MPLLDEKAIASRLQLLPRWKLDGGELVRRFEFPNFVEAMQFVNSVAELAEGAGHHPDIDIR
jgi:4a-hydroxytetrahydrobiopterin dehydratase